MAAATSRKLFVGGNWKCKLGLQASLELVEGLKQVDMGAVDVCIAPTPLFLDRVNNVATGSGLIVSSQNISRTGFGAYTGEFCAEQILDLGVTWTLVGHSERRTYYGDTNEIVKEKVEIALTNNLKVIACFGETLEHREAGNTEAVNFEQLAAIAAGVANGKWGDVVLAYEPVWAIGTGRTCPSDEAERMCGLLRGWLAENVSAEVALATRIIYGGSVKAKNCQELIAMENIDGFLVGGASLSVEKFEPIIAAAKL